MKFKKQDPFEYQILFTCNNLHLSIFIESHATKCFLIYFENRL